MSLLNYSQGYKEISITEGYTERSKTCSLCLEPRVPGLEGGRLSPGPPGSLEPSPPPPPIGRVAFCRGSQWQFFFISQGPSWGSGSTESHSRFQIPPNPKPSGLPRRPSAPSWLPRPPVTVASPPLSSLTRRESRWTLPLPLYTQTIVTPKSVLAPRVQGSAPRRQVVSWRFSVCTQLPVMCEKTDCKSR